ncbi:MAG: Crp/Fnr family transcriptional regulator [Actinobacteria bacterium]|nr:Crp/Fnr family transcriptional regulator [Actinomycetota bacterium]
MAGYIEYLKNIFLFSYLNEEQLAEVDSLIMERDYRRGRIIFVEGEPGEAVFFLREGRIKISKQTEDGREQILHFIHPGEMFAEVVLFDGGDYPATAEAVEDSRVGMIRNSDMERITLGSPGIALGILRIMSKRLRMAQKQINDLALMDTSRRMASTLMFLAAEQGVSCEKGIVIDMSLTNQDLANMIGTSRETANRILSDMRRQKALQVENRQIIIIDMKKLKSWM